VSLVFDDGGFSEDATFLLALHWHPNADAWQSSSRARDG
jgi:hypothetical protein